MVSPLRPRAQSHHRQIGEWLGLGIEGLGQGIIIGQLGLVHIPEYYDSKDSQQPYR